MGWKVGVGQSNSLPPQQLLLLLIRHDTMLGHQEMPRDVDDKVGFWVFFYTVFALKFLHDLWARRYAVSRSP